MLKKKWTNKEERKSTLWLNMSEKVRCVIDCGRESTGWLKE